MGKWSDIAKHITLVGQLGLSIIMPLLLCMGFSWFLTSKFGVGSWIFIVGIFFGLGSSFMTAWKFYMAETGKAKKEDKKKKVSFNQHQ